MEIRVQPDTETHQRHEAGNQTAQPLTAYASIFALVLLAVVPFAGRAVNLDEPQYLHFPASAPFHDWRFCWRDCLVSSTTSNVRADCGSSPYILFSLPARDTRPLYLLRACWRGRL